MIRVKVISVIIFIVCGIASCEDQEQVIPSSETIQMLVKACSLKELPQGTERVRLEILYKSGVHYFEAECDCKRDLKENSLLLNKFQIKPKEEVPKEVLFSDKVVKEDPLTSVRRCIKAIQKKDAKTLIPYIPAQGRKEIDRMRVLDLRHKDKEKMEYTGFSDFEILLKHLPKISQMPAGIGALKLQVQFPGEAKGEKGSYEIKVGVYTGDKEPDKWIIQQMLVKFIPAKGKQRKEGLKD